MYWAVSIRDEIDRERFCFDHGLSVTDQRHRALFEIGAFGGGGGFGDDNSGRDT
jgi:hypothetical protein